MNLIVVLKIDNHLIVNFASLDLYKYNESCLIWNKKSTKLNKSTIIIIITTHPCTSTHYLYTFINSVAFHTAFTFSTFA